MFLSLHHLLLTTHTHRYLSHVFLRDVLAENVARRTPRSSGPPSARPPGAADLAGPEFLPLPTEEPGFSQRLEAD